ncbi:hypothetical protein Tco_0128063, partial [Tanacetum coccineum]
VKMDDPNITIKEYIRLEEEKARRMEGVYTWECFVWYQDGVSWGMDMAYQLTVQVLVIMEYLVNISKRRAFWSLNKDILKINDSDNQYAVSIKEDTAYPCLHSPKTTKETSSIRRIQRNSIRRIQDIVCEYSGRYQTWSLLQETSIRRIQCLGYAVSNRLPEEKKSRRGRATLSIP